MSYVAPAGDAVVLSFAGAYGAPAGDEVLLDFAPTAALLSGETVIGVASSATAMLGRVGAAAVAIGLVVDARGGVLVAGAAAATIGLVGEALGNVPVTGIGAVDVGVTSGLGRIVAATAAAWAAVGVGAASSGTVPALESPNLPTSMTAFKFDLDIEQGTTFSRTTTWKVGDPAGPIKFVGCSARAQIRDSVGADEVLLELTTENSRIVLGVDAGTVEIALSAEDTAALPVSGGVYDLEVVYADGRVRRLLRGRVLIRPEVTR